MSVSIYTLIFFSMDIPQVSLIPLALKIIPPD